MGLLKKAVGRDIDKRVFESAGTDIIETAPKKSLNELIDQYQRIYADFNCILLDFPEEMRELSEETRADFCKKVSEMFNQSQNVIPLSSGRPLILLPAAKDRELIAHRLTKSLNTRALFSIEANNPEIVLKQINNLALNEK